MDRKFIVAIVEGRTSKSGKFSNFLVLFDQHAVDERVRLETNLKGNLMLFNKHFILNLVTNVMVSFVMYYTFYNSIYFIFKLATCPCFALAHP